MRTVGYSGWGRVAVWVKGGSLEYSCVGLGVCVCGCDCVEVTGRVLRLCACVAVCGGIILAW